MSAPMESPVPRAHSSSHRSTRLAESAAQRHHPKRDTPTFLLARIPEIDIEEDNTSTNYEQSKHFYAVLAHVEIQHQKPETTQALHRDRIESLQPDSS